jgi:hypothetical protein
MCDDPDLDTLIEKILEGKISLFVAEQFVHAHGVLIKPAYQQDLICQKIAAELCMKIRNATPAEKPKILDEFIAELPESALEKLLNQEPQSHIKVAFKALLTKNLSPEIAQYAVIADIPEFVGSIKNSNQLRLNFIDTLIKKAQSCTTPAAKKQLSLEVNFVLTLPNSPMRKLMLEAEPLLTFIMKQVTLPDAALTIVNSVLKAQQIFVNLSKSAQDTVQKIFVTTSTYSEFIRAQIFLAHSAVLSEDKKLQQEVKKIIADNFTQEIAKIKNNANYTPEAKLKALRKLYREYQEAKYQLPNNNPLITLMVYGRFNNSCWNFFWQHYTRFSSQYLHPLVKKIYATSRTDRSIEQAFGQAIQQIRRPVSTTKFWLPWFLSNNKSNITPVAETKRDTASSAPVSHASRF